MTASTNASGEAGGEEREQLAREQAGGARRDAGRVEAGGASVVLVHRRPSGSSCRPPGWRH